MKKFRDGGIYTAEMGQPPQDIDGGSVTPMPKRTAPMPKRPAPMRTKPGAEGAMMKREGRGMAKADMQKKEKPKAYKSGGSVSARADGCAKKGKTNCKMV
jgi:hypothetical protein